MTSTDPKSANTPTAPDPVLAVGHKLAGCYVLQKQVATGDATIIWLAHDEVLGKDISLQFLPPQVRADARAMEEIRKEVKRNRQLIHPNILRVHDFVEEPEFAAIAMDSFDAESLASHLKKRGTFEAGAIQPWIGPLCQTLEEAHKIHLIHRDLAPANIYLGENGKVLVAGFGISRCVQDALGRIARGANPRLSYLSPQLADGQTPARTDDVYSLGMLLFELLTGELPFNGGDVHSQIRRVAAPRVSARLAAGRRTVELPASWDETIAAALRKDAAQRPATVADIAARLEKVPAIALHAPEAAAPAAKAGETSKSGSKIVAAAKAPAPEKRPEPESAKPAADAKPPEPAKAGAGLPTDPPPRKAVEILRERAAELARNQASKPSGINPPPTLTVVPPPADSAASKDSKAAPPPPPPAKKDAAADIYPNLYPQRSRVPALGVAAGVALAAIGLAGYYLNDPGTPEPSTDDEAEVATTEQPYGSEIRSVTHKTELPSAASAEPEVSLPTAPPDPAPVIAAAPIKAAPAATPAPAPTPAITAPPVAAITPPKAPEVQAPIIVAAARRPATPTPAPAPAAQPRAAVPASTTPLTEQTVAEKVAAVEKLKLAEQAAELEHLNLMKEQQKAEAAAADIQKILDQKSKDAAPLRKAAEDLAKSRKAKEDAQKAADLEAQRAQQVAAEKARLAEEARKALADLEAQNKEKLSAQEKAESELLALQKTLAEKRQAAAAVTKLITNASAARAQQAAAVKQAEQEAEQTKMVVAKAMAAETARIAREEAEKMRAEKAKEREKIEGEIAAMRKMFEEKMKVLEDAQKALTDAESKSKDTEAMQKKAEEDALKILNKTTAPAGGKPAIQDKAPSAGALVPSDNPLTPTATATAPAATLAMKTDPTVKPSTPTPPAPDKAATQGAGLVENSIGMKFAPVGDVHFAIWQTRVQDFEIFAKAVSLRSNAWKGPGFKQAGDHPVVNVTWQEAFAFCKWLTDKERKDGALPASQLYRLPSDLEWSKAVGLPDETGKHPEARDMGIPDVYPWGNQWPPPAGAGNYTGEETGSDVAIKGYDDGFAWTSPVGSFPPNKYGLYDMGGNVWQWVMDAWNSDSKHKVLRGASWYNGALKLSLLSSCRVHAPTDSSTDNYGFRVVRAAETGKSGR